MVFGNLGNMGNILKMAQEMKGKLKQVKEQLARETHEGLSGGTKVIVTGDMEVKEVKLNPQLANDLVRLENEVKNAAQKALKAAKESAANQMKGLTGGLGLPGLM